MITNEIKNNEGNVDRIVNRCILLQIIDDVELTLKAVNFQVNKTK